jgi:hypothetical protein
MVRQQSFLCRPLRSSVIERTDVARTHNLAGTVKRGQVAADPTAGDGIEA